MNKRDKKMTRQEIIEMEYDSLFTGPGGEYKIDNAYYDIEIHNNLPKDQSLIFSRPTQCDFCGLEHKDNCAFAFQNDTTLETIMSLMKHDRDLELTINWKPNAKINYSMVEQPNF